MICDLAEVYGVYDYRTLPVETLAALCAGLRDTSRVSMAQHDVPADTDRMLLAMAVDSLSYLVWAITSALSGEPLSRPGSVVDVLTGNTPVNRKQEECFDTPEAFEEERKRIMGGGR